MVGHGPSFLINTPHNNILRNFSLYFYSRRQKIILFERMLINDQISDSALQNSFTNFGGKGYKFHLASLSLNLRTLVKNSVKSVSVC